MWEEEREERSRGHMEMCKSGTEVNKARYRNMKNQAKKVVAKAMKEPADRAGTELSELNEKGWEKC